MQMRWLYDRYDIVDKYIGTVILWLIIYIFFFIIHFLACIKAKCKNFDVSVA